MINLAEIVNPCLQLVIFSLLTMDYDGYRSRRFHILKLKGNHGSILVRHYELIIVEYISTRYHYAGPSL